MDISEVKKNLHKAKLLYKKQYKEAKFLEQQI